MLSLDPRPHDGGALVSETADLMRPLAAEKALTFHVERPSSPVEVTCDRERILQALANLVGNAIKFTPPGGTIGIAVEEREAEVRFTVSDSGPGIPPDELPHIFDRFWKAHGDVSAPGAGLGLSIVKGLVAAHGGSVSVDSRLGVGSVFRLSLPVTPGTRARRGDADRPAAPTVPPGALRLRESSR
jgi:signal transduction histidine kinase